MSCKSVVQDTYDLDIVWSMPSLEAFSLRLEEMPVNLSQVYALVVLVVSHTEDIGHQLGWTGLASQRRPLAGLSLLLSLLVSAAQRHE